MYVRIELVMADGRMADVFMYDDDDVCMYFGLYVCMSDGQIWVLPDDNPILPVSNHNDKISVFINEPGICRLIFSSKAPLADSFTDWVVSEVLPSIRQTGSYMTKEAAIEKWG
jgi:hypothetical protein